MGERVEARCERLGPYLDNRLTAEQAREFEAHAERCESCGREVRAWARLNQEIAEGWADEAARRRPTLPDARALSRRLEERRREPPRVFRPMWAAAAAVVVLAIVAVAILSRRGGEDGSIAVSRHAVEDIWLDAELFEAPGGVATDLRFRLGETISAPGASWVLADLGRDRLGIGSGSLARVVSFDNEGVRIALERGRVACEVTPRRRRFVVSAGPHEVMVTGTRFFVERGEGDELTVAVSRGSVEIGGREPARGVGAGERASIAADGTVRIDPVTSGDREVLTWLLDHGSRPEMATDREIPAESIGEPAEPEEAEEAVRTKRRRASSARSDQRKGPLPHGGLEQWKQWIIEGRLADAERELEAHVESHPGDHQAWGVLAQCRRKQGRWEEAVSAYLAAVETEKGPAANLYRFRAAKLLQDKLRDPVRAAGLLEEYLAHSGAESVRRDAELRLARAYRASGRHAAARGSLEALVTEHPGTSAAESARQLLGEMGE